MPTNQIENYFWRGSINLREILKRRHYDLLDIGENMNGAMLQVISELEDLV